MQMVNREAMRSLNMKEKRICEVCYIICLESCTLWLHINHSSPSAAYKDADGLKLDGRRVLVDVERGRTVKGWKPRRLGGGLGNTRSGGAEQTSRSSGRDGTSSGGSDRYRDRGGSSSHGYGSRHNGNPSRRDHGFQDRRGRTRSRSRSPRGHRDKEHDRYGGRGRDRSRDNKFERGPRRDRWVRASLSYSAFLSFFFSLSLSLNTV